MTDRTNPNENPESPAPVRSSLEPLLAAIESVSRLGKFERLVRWMDRELDAEGVPRTLPVRDWREGLQRLANAIGEGPVPCPDRVEALAEGWFLALLRLSRPDGSPSFGPTGTCAEARRVLRFWANRLPDPGYDTVLDWWFPEKSTSRSRHAPPPLPADARPDRPLAVLRSHWLKGGDFLALDHRSPSTRSLIEICAGGRPWIGPGWDVSPSVSDRVTRARPTLWRTQSAADVAEWSFRVGKARV
ncbi:MAG: hypothetical protein AB7I30_23025, partial [Isosphaeraceae bacterium]